MVPLSPTKHPSQPCKQVLPIPNAHWAVELMKVCADAPELNFIFHSR